MRHHQHAKAGGQRLDLHPLRNAAADTEVRLRNINAALDKQIPETVAGKLGLAAGNRDGNRVAHPAVTGTVLGHHRFLDPVHPEFFQLAPDTDGGDGVVGVVAIDQQPDIGADAAPHGGHALQILFDRQQADLHLENVEPAGNVGGRLDLKVGNELRLIPGAVGVVAARRIGVHRSAESAAHQGMHRLAQRLAPQVPQRNVDGADRLDIGAFLTEIARKAVKTIRGNHRSTGWRADQQRGQNVIDARRHRFRRAVLAALAPTGQTGIGGDLDQQTVTLGEFCLRRIEGLAPQRHPQNECLY